ncbi:MAG: YCF48-related protein, partial [Flavobacteriales bacterium]
MAHRHALHRLNAGSLLLTISIPAFVVPAQAQWVQQSFTPFGHALGVHILDDQHALASGAPGVIYETLDAGSNWTEVVVPPPLGPLMSFDSLGGVYMIDPDTWIVSGYSTFEIAEIIIRTTDAGVQWDMVHLGPDFTGCYDMTFVSATTGLAVGKAGRILRTTDAGATWAAVVTPTAA